MEIHWSQWSLAVCHVSEVLLLRRTRVTALAWGSLHLGSEHCELRCALFAHVFVKFRSFHTMV